jgi:hypothetical protein
VHFSKLLLGFSVAFSCGACDRVSWPVSRELCGQIQIVDKQTRTVLKDTDLLLYRSKSTHTPCCSDADPVADLRTDATGIFNSGKLQAGRYFVAVKNFPQIVFQIFLEKDYDGVKCSLNTVFSFDRNTGKTEQSVTILLEPST